MSHRPRRRASFNSTGEGDALSLIVLKPSECSHSNGSPRCCTARGMNGRPLTINNEPFTDGADSAGTARPTSGLASAERRVICGPAPGFGAPTGLGVGRHTPATVALPRKLGAGLGLNPSVERQPQMLSATACPHAMPIGIESLRPEPGTIAAIDAARAAAVRARARHAGGGLMRRAPRRRESILLKS